MNEAEEKVKKENIIKALKRVNFCIVNDGSLSEIHAKHIHYFGLNREIYIYITYSKGTYNPHFRCGIGMNFLKNGFYRKENEYFLYEFIWHYSLLKIKTPSIVYELLYNLPKIYPKIDRHVFRIIIKHYINIIISQRMDPIVQKIRDFEKYGTHVEYTDLFTDVFESKFNFDFNKHEITDNFSFVKTKEEFTPLKPLAEFFYKKI